ncbi:hypothetical protein PCCS19_16190 [Paenibacillus sp. CCS19]|nr:hypothetical protein PCCS19_16190 [Paenibacillus cellulosilyticus]
MLPADNEAPLEGWNATNALSLAAIKGYLFVRGQKERAQGAWTNSCLSVGRSHCTMCNGK